MPTNRDTVDGFDKKYWLVREMVRPHCWMSVFFLPKPRIRLVRSSAEKLLCRCKMKRLDDLAQKASIYFYDGFVGEPKRHLFPFSRRVSGCAGVAIIVQSQGW